MYTPYSKISLGVLIFQDIVIVPMILLTPILAGVPSASGSSSPFIFILKGIGIMFFVIVSARWALPALLFRIVKTRNRELFLLTIIFIIFGTAWLTSYAGLSLALGAFLAGLIISESEYSHQAIGNMMPLKDVFMSFFFISIGMLMDASFFIQNITILLVLAGAVILIKSAAAGLVTFLLGHPLRVAIITGMTLAQVGEFSFVLSSFGKEYGLLDDNLYQVFLAVSIVTMAVTPTVMSSSHRISDAILKKTTNSILVNGIYSKSMVPVEEVEELHDHLIIIGYGFNGKTLSNAAKTAGIPYVIIETNPETVRHERKNGERIHYGDATHEIVLDAANVKSARILIVGISDYIATRTLVQVARRMNPELFIIARTRYMNEIQMLNQMGADEVIPEEYETSVEIFVRLLKKYLVPEEDIDKFTREIRANAYDMLRNPSSKDQQRSFDIKDELPGMEVITFKLAENCAADGKTLKELNIRAKYKATVLAIHRGDETITNPHGDDTIYSGDSCIIFGKPDDLHTIRELFKGPDEK